jgi:hypothetical protein
MAKGMNWERVRYETNTGRWGTESLKGDDLPTAPEGRVRRRTSHRKQMTPEEARRWKAAIAKVYGPKHAR